jgi:hypothetical protein
MKKQRLTLKPTGEACLQGMLAKGSLSAKVFKRATAIHKHAGKIFKKKSNRTRKAAGALEIQTASLQPGEDTPGQDNPNIKTELLKNPLYWQRVIVNHRSFSIEQH